MNARRLISVGFVVAILGIVAVFFSNRSKSGGVAEAPVENVKPDDRLNPRATGGSRNSPENKVASVSPPSHSADVIPSDQFAELLPAELRKLPRDPKIEKFFLGSNIGEKGKRIFLSTLALLQNQESMTAESFNQAKMQIVKEIQSDRGDLVGDLKTLLANPSDFPPGTEKEILSVAAHMDAFDSPEVQNLAFSEVKNAAKEMASGGSPERVLDAMEAMSTASSYSADTWTKISESIDSSDIQQSRILENAEHAIKMKQRVR